MKSIKLQENESLLDSFELDICIMEDKLKAMMALRHYIDFFWQSPFMTNWHHVNLYFTSKRIELHLKREQLSISYKDVKNFDISDLRCRLPKTPSYIGLAGLFSTVSIIFLATIKDGLSSYGSIVLAIGSVIIIYQLIFSWVMTDNIYFGKQIEFAIKKDDEIIERIKDAYEKGKHFNKKKEIN